MKAAGVGGFWGGDGSSILMWSSRITAATLHPPHRSGTYGQLSYLKLAHMPTPAPQTPSQSSLHNSQQSLPLLSRSFRNGEPGSVSWPLTRAEIRINLVNLEKPNVSAGRSRRWSRTLVGLCVEFISGGASYFFKWSYCLHKPVITTCLSDSCHWFLTFIFYFVSCHSLRWVWYWKTELDERHCTNPPPVWTVRESYGVQSCMGPRPLHAGTVVWILTRWN